MGWKTVYVFISSTFNDMHAERDYLVKYIFPELRMWCAKRKLKLVDVDLRWGVSAADAQENKRVVEVCMRNIDKCRPFFLCFMGQRRGWVPKEEDVNVETLRLFPELKKYLGKTSVTEMEILHALLHPLSEGVMPVEHARFYFREKGYLKQLHTAVHKDLFCPKRGLFSREDKDLEHFKKEISRRIPVVQYTAKWNEQKTSPELSGELAKGRLEDFRVGGDTLGQDILNWIQGEIAQAFPEHTEVSVIDSPLELELDYQDTQLFQVSDGYISRPYEENALMELLREDAKTPILLLADAGAGKTSLLAHMIHRLENEQKIYYRFAGTTPQSFQAGTLAASLVEQWIQDGLLPEEDGKHTPGEFELLFSNLMIKAGEKQSFILVIDGIDQISGRVHEHFLPRTLPKGCKLIFSLRRDAEYVPDQNVRIHSLGMMNDRDDKIQMVKSYLNTFLKDVDEDQLEQIISMPGSGNPLYMKIVLNELRQHGSFDTLFEMLSKDYGTTPLEAFCQVILRIKKQLASQGIAESFINIFFGSLAYTSEGLDGDFFYKMKTYLANSGLEDLSETEVHDLVYGLARELESFLVMDGNKILLRYDSLRRAYIKMESYYEPTNHSLLALAFASRAMGDDIPRYMEHAMYHLTNALENVMSLYFGETGALLWTIRHNGSRLLAETCRTIAEERKLSDFADLAKVFSKAGARLDIYPETLFMEFRRYGDANNSVIIEILKNEHNYADKQYLIPVSSCAAASLIQDEYVITGTYIHNVVYDEPYYAIYADEVVRIVDRRTSRLVNILYPEGRLGFYDSFKIAAGDGMLYLIHTNKGKLLSCKRYSLPDLTLLSDCTVPELSDFHPFQLKVVDGKLYAFCCKMIKTESDKVFLQPHPTIPSLICVNTGETLFSEAFSDDCDYRFLGKYLLLRDMGSGRWYIIHTATGKILVEDQFLGYENVNRVNLLVGGANLYAGLGKNLCLWLSGTGVEDNKMKMVYDIHNYKILENGELELISASDYRDVHCSCLNALSSGHIITGYKGAISILNENLEILGHYDLRESIQSSSDWGGKFYLTEEDTLLLFRSNKIQKLSLSYLLSNLQENKSYAGSTKCDVLVKNGWLYVFGQKISRTNLETLEKQLSPGDAGLIERICPWNLDESNKCISTAYNGINYTVHDLEMKQPPVKYEVAQAEKYLLLHAFQYQDSSEKTVLVQVVADKTPCECRYNWRKESFFQCYLRILKDMEDPECRWETHDLRAKIKGKAANEIRVESIVMDQNAYIVLPNIYKDVELLELRVYRVNDPELTYRHACSVEFGPLKSGTLHCYDQGVLFSYKNNDTCLLVDLSLDQMKAFNDKTGRVLMNSPIRDGYAYFRQGKSLDIDIYDLKTHKIVKSFTLSERKGFLVEQILRVKDKLIVRNFNSDILEVYDYERGKKLFDQRMEQVLADLYVDPQSGRIAMVDTSQRVYVWKMKE